MLSRAQDFTGIFRGQKSLKIRFFQLRMHQQVGTLVAVKNWPYILIALIVLCGTAYLVYTDRQRLGLAHFGGATSSGKSASQISPVDETNPTPIQWRTLNRTADGFRIDLPPGSKEMDAPAHTESGGTEPVKMLYASPDGDTVFAVTWQDNPPIARANNNVPDRTLDQSREGMLARTQTMLLNESRITFGGFPGREILAHNASGGVLNARLIYVQNSSNHDRLYTLMALFPTAGARREQDVTHFFDSFALAGARN